MSMKNFWSYISNGSYSIGTTGGTVYLFDKNLNEIRKFQDIKYAYTPMFSPDGKMFIVKSTDGMLAIYSLETLSLIKKFRFSDIDGAQDDGFCFSPDSKLFINIERQNCSTLFAVSVYKTDDFSRISQLICDKRTVLSHIEYDGATNEYYVLGNNRNFRTVGFIAKFKNNNIVDKVKISKDELELYNIFLGLKISGFTEKAFRWSYCKNELDELKSLDLTLSALYNKHLNNT